MTQPNDGGPAFPRPFSHDPNWGDYGKDYYEQNGMSRRDWLAGVAMQGFVSHPENLVAIRLSAEQAGITAPAMMARTAYGMADAMIAESGRLRIDNDD